MARFDVYRGKGRPDLLLDCQSNLLHDLKTRFVVPLRPLDRAPPPTNRLNPVFVIEQQSWIMMTQAAAAVSVRELGPLVVSMIEEDFAIANALDLLIYGV